MRPYVLAAGLVLLAGCGVGKRAAEFPELELARRQGLITTVEEAERRNMPLPDDISHLYLEKKSVIDSPAIKALGGAQSLEEARVAFAKASKALKEIEPLGEH